MDDPRGRPPPRERYDDSRGRYDDSEGPPPPSAGDDDRLRQLPPPLPNLPMAPGAVNLPPISEYHYPPPPDHRGDPRARGDYSASPTSVNGYGPPPNQQPRPGPLLPTVHPPPPDQRGYPDPRSGDYGRAAYPEPYRNHNQYPAPYGGYQGPPPPGPPPHPHAQPYPPQPYGGYAYPPGAGQPQQAAPRQRTSIACRYCRKRKIRCSGYQNTPEGKCTNCRKTGNECIFQPVSSGSSTAFVPLSAVQGGGIAPGTPLYGAFGQPLHQSTPGPASTPPQPTYPPSSGSDYALPSPTSSGGGYYQSPEERGPQTGQRRPRPPEEPQGMRLPPPPGPYPDDDLRDKHRRSPRERTPPGYHPYSREYDADPRRPSPPESSRASAGSEVMRMSNLMESSRPDSTREIDRGMLGRLNNGRRN